MAYRQEAAMPRRNETAKDAPASQTITDKAHNLMVLANQVQHLSGAALRKITPPVPENAKEAGMPEPDHLVFILEAVEESLRAASLNLDLLNSRL